jgi:hypothetical protein
VELKALPFGWSRMGNLTKSNTQLENVFALPRNLQEYVDLYEVWGGRQ